MVAGGVTALTTIALTVYAWNTKVQVEYFGALIYVVYMAMFPIAILSFIFISNTLVMVYNILGILFYSLFLIYDTILICKGNK